MASGEMLEVSDWPRTKEEREIAAKKYNLIPEDYEPYEEGDGFGDYPKLKAVGGFNRDPYEDFDDPYEHRNYGEPYHVHADLYTWDRIDPLRHEKGHESYWYQVLMFTIIGLTIPVIKIGIFDRYNINLNFPWKHRKFHPSDQKYYEFPKSDSSHH